MNEESENNSITLNSRMTFLNTFSVPDELMTEFSEFGGKIDKLLSKPEIETDENAVGLLDDLLGAIYCLILAAHHEFENRTDKAIEVPVVQIRASQIHNRKIRIDGKWIAGWHFNSSLFRISAVYHRLLKLVDGNPSSKEYASEILSRVKLSYTNWTGLDWSEDSTHLIHKEVNILKHETQGLYPARKVTFEDVIKSVKELLDLIATWSESSHTST